MTTRNAYPVNIVINGRLITQAIIDSHYKVNHPDIDDKLILDLIQTFNGREFKLDERKDSWEYYMLDQIPFRDKKYRLVWCMQDNQLFIGIINCFRR